MKKNILLIFFVVIIVIDCNAQERTKTSTVFNRWSIEGNIGLTKPYLNFSSGYWAGTPDFLAGEVGVRYMLNEFFGLKIDFGYNQFSNQENSHEFSTDEYRVDMQGVVNVGRVLKFENWTHTFNVLAHGGLGVGKINYDQATSAEDYVGNVIGGLTGQIKLSPRVAMNLDFSTFSNIRQNLSFNGAQANSKHFGVVFNTTVGLTVYLGKNKIHADWEESDTDQYFALESKITKLGAEIKESKTKTDSIQAEVKKVQTDVAEIAQKVNEVTEGNEQVSVNNGSRNYEDFVQGLINDGYTNIYFQFNSSRVLESSLRAISLLTTYLQKNPEVKVKLFGFADERGTDDYNKVLSQKRAQAVTDLLIEVGIDKSRLTLEGKGKDLSMDFKSEVSRQMARRVSFVLGNETVRIGENAVPQDFNDDGNLEKEPVFITFNVKTVHFVMGKYFLTDYSKGRLDILLSFLAKNPDCNLNIYGFTDDQASDEYNQAIAQKRVDAVIDYLTSNGLDRSKIYGIDVLGKELPVASNETEEGRLLNRRVEFEIFKLQ